MDDDAKLATKAEALVAWASDLLVTVGRTIDTRQAIADAVRRLGTEVFLGDETTLSSLHGAGAAAAVLARAIDGPVLMLAAFRPTPRHPSTTTTRGGSYASSGAVIGI